VLYSVLLQRLRWSAYWLDDPWSRCAYSNFDSNSNGDVDAHSNIYSDIYAYADANCNGNADANSYTYSDTETFTDAETGANAEAAPNSAAAAVASSTKKTCTA